VKNKYTLELAVCGINAVKALEKKNVESISRLYVSAERAPLFGSLCKILAARRIPYNTKPDEELQKLCGSVHHQGVVAMISAPDVGSVTDDDIAVWVEDKEKILVLDNVGNANNFGAIVRSAAFFGVRNIVVENGMHYVTTSSYRIAEGGMEYVAIYTTESVADLLKSVKGKIVSVGTDARGDVPASRLGSVTKNSAAFLVIGNEERGISRDVRAHCDIIIGIAPWQKNQPNIESLNVAQAASILLYEIEISRRTGFDAESDSRKKEVRYERTRRPSV
jgi:TrmH RNA methyltransferase